MGVVNAEISLDELRKFVPKFVNATTLEVGNELMRQAALMVRGDSDFGLLHLTPPKGFIKGKEMGNRAVRNDIQKVFVSHAALIKAIGVVAERGSVTTYKRYVASGDYEGAKKFLNGQTADQVQVKGYKAKRRGKVVSVRPYTQRKNVSALNIPRLGSVQAISNFPMASLHQSRRRKSGDSTGRVYREAWAQVVLKKTSLKQYIEEKQKRVGMLKAGWAKASKDAKLNVSIPQFILGNMGRAQGSGRSSFASPLNMYVELVNSFPVASSKIEQGDIDFLIQTRQDNILKELEYKMGKIAKAT